MTDEDVEWMAYIQRPPTNDPEKIIITLDAAGRIARIEPDLGNVLVIRINNGKDFNVEWELDLTSYPHPGTQFRLKFKRLDFSGVNNQNPNWPFNGTGPGDPDHSPWATNFEGRHIRDGAYKYWLFVQDATGNEFDRVDPVIIVGRV